ncbi:hypothetical protein PENTCL1PPCAC_14078, partial [Pristionchus entomophagus]
PLVGSVTSGHIEVDVAPEMTVLLQQPFYLFRLRLRVFLSKIGAEIEVEDVSGRCFGFLRLQKFVQKRANFHLKLVD